MKNFLKKYWIYIVAIVLPWLITLIRCAISGLWFFGDGDLLRGDMSEQLVPFYYEIWHRIHNGDFSLYLWNAAGGVDLSTIMGYLYSPFSLIVLLCPEAHIADAVQFIMIAKWSAISYSMVFFFCHTKINTMKENKRIVALFLGCSYALSNSMINFVGYIQFGDAMICFPFLLLLLENMFRTGKWKLYFVLLSLSIISNMFITYEICIMLLFWFCLLIIIDHNNWKQKTIVFIGSSLLSAVNAIALVIPGINSFGDRIIRDNTIDSNPYFIGFLMSPMTFIKQLFFYNDIGLPSDITPNLYFSVIGVLLVILFAFIKIDVKQKIYLISISLFMTASFFVGELSIIWHCFVIPNNVYHRFSNFYVFILLILAMYVLIYIDQIRRMHIIAVSIISLVLFAVAFFNIDTYLSVVIYLVTILLVVFYCIMLYFYTTASISYRNIIRLICILGIAELSINGYHAFRNYQFNEGFISRFKYMFDIDNDINLDKGERYVCSRFVNSGMVLSNNSDDGFVSGINLNNLILHRKLGMPYNGKVEYCINGASPIVNLIYNISYVIGLDDSSVSDAECIKTKGDYSLYKIKRLAGLGYMVDSDIVNWDIDEGTCFDIQNDYIRHTTGMGDVFKKAYPNVEAYNANGDLIKLDEVALEGGVYAYNYKHIGSGFNDFISNDIIVDEDMDMYIHIMCDSTAYVQMLIDDEIVHIDQTLFKQNTLHVGKVSKGQHIMINIYEPNAVAGNMENVMMYFANFNDDAYSDAYDILSKNVMLIKGEVSDVVNGSIVADKKGIMMTSIQASDNWKVYVDGSQVEYETIGGALVGVPLDKGEHDIKFVYYPSRLFMGFYIALGGWMIFAGICINSLIKKKKGRLSD